MVVHILQGMSCRSNASRDFKCPTRKKGTTMQPIVSRRDLVKGSSLVAAGVALAGVSSSAIALENQADKTFEDLFAGAAAEFAPIDEAQIKETREYDVVVVGAGTAGVPAAMSALEAGATVACLQKEVCPISQGSGANGVVAS